MLNLFKKKMGFGEVVKTLLNLRHSKPEKFYRNSRGVMQIHFKAECYWTNGSPIGLRILYYADQNPNTKSRYANKVRCGELLQDQVGWLWMGDGIVGKKRIKRIDIAGICPDGVNM